MSRRGAYGKRPSGAWQPTERQRQVLGALAEGKTNAEIAVRLGITVDGAKWHVGELLLQTGVADRQALAAWWGKAREPRRSLVPAWLLRRPWLTVPVLGVVGLIALGQMLPDRRDTRDEIAITTTPVAVEEPLVGEAPSATCEPGPETGSGRSGAPPDMEIVKAEDLTAAGLMRVGQLIVAPGCPLYVANRADRAVVWSAGEAELAPPGPITWRIQSPESCCAMAVSYRFEYSGQAYRVTLQSSASTLLGYSLITQAPVRWTGSGYLTVRLYSGTGIQSSLALASDGSIYVSAWPLPADRVINAYTGEVIDTTNLKPAGRLGQFQFNGSLDTICDLGPPVSCTVRMMAFPTTLRAPIAGRLTCKRDQGPTQRPSRYELETPDFRLIFRLQDLAEQQGPPCEDRDVQMDEDLKIPAAVVILGQAKSGDALPVVVSDDGHLFVGDVRLQFGCPCQ